MTLTVRQVRAGAQLVAIQYPEYWVAVLSCIAWIALLGISLGSRSVGVLCPAHGEMAALNMRSRMNGGLEQFSGIGWLSWHWLLMLGAMMLPPVLDALKGAARRSLWFRRQRTIALVLLGYLTLWAVCGMLMEIFWRSASAIVANSLLAYTLVIAAVWQMTPVKKWGLSGCHAEALLVPSGWRADCSCLRFGLMLATRCCVSCWLLMLACAASGHALWVTLLITCVMWTERFRPRAWLGWSALALSGAALVTWIPVIAM